MATIMQRSGKCLGRSLSYNYKVSILTNVSGASIHKNHLKQRNLLLLKIVQEDL